MGVLVFLSGGGRVVGSFHEFGRVFGRDRWSLLPLHPPPHRSRSLHKYIPNRLLVISHKLHFPLSFDMNHTDNHEWMGRGYGRGNKKELNDVCFDWLSWSGWLLRPTSWFGYELGEKVSTPVGLLVLVHVLVSHDTGCVFWGVRGNCWEWWTGHSPAQDKAGVRSGRTRSVVLEAILALSLLSFSFRFFFRLVESTSR
ncbi:hypothetical protein B0H66DRAFT_182426 [Apodospora peruviana]|uniref:Uncharacterized protein n=1 Tax=Apodospora peruviana TaxID=516989 RepID=A0AAE0IB40_9PEZI|nr:hypothetical protein B0H66DRAFT_182426 [Apodospora peruviana]